MVLRADAAHQPVSHQCTLQADLKVGLSITAAPMEGPT
jgi:hypothetical protein